MTDIKTPVETLSSLVELANKSRTLKKLVFSKPVDKSIVKVVCELHKIGENVVFQAQTHQKDNKVIYKNYNTADFIRDLPAFCAGFSQINLITSLGECEYKRSSKADKETLIGDKKLASKLSGATESDALQLSGNNREKKYILSGSEEFLVYLGVSDKNGRVYDKKQPKFRQINRFLENVRDICKHLPAKDQPLYVADLCCGKSYLSFAVYHYFANILGRKIEMVGVDLKSDVIAYCEQTARKLGFDGLSFICGDINAFVPAHPPHLVISLHACDIATDIVLENAVKWNADVILSTPCCHHFLNHNIDCPELSFICDYSMLRQKLCDAATDALRLKMLESEGYTTAALELIDPDETPKNVLLQAIKKKRFDKTGAEAKKLREEYESVRRFLLGKNI